MTTRPWLLAHLDQKVADLRDEVEAVVTERFVGQPNALPLGLFGSNGKPLAESEDRGSPAPT